MRIRDWSSDVCSSDLRSPPRTHRSAGRRPYARFPHPSRGYRAPMAADPDVMDARLDDLERRTEEVHRQAEEHGTLPPSDPKPSFIDPDGAGRIADQDGDPGTQLRARPRATRGQRLHGGKQGAK